MGVDVVKSGDWKSVGPGQYHILDPSGQPLKYAPGHPTMGGKPFIVDLNKLKSELVKRVEHAY